MKNDKPKKTRIREKGLEGVPAVGLRKKLEGSWDQTPDRGQQMGMGLRVRKGGVGTGDRGLTSHGGVATQAPAVPPPQPPGCPRLPTRSTYSSTM